MATRYQVAIILLIKELLKYVDQEEAEGPHLEAPYNLFIIYMHHSRNVAHSCDCRFQ